MSWRQLSLGALQPQTHADKSTVCPVCKADHTGRHRCSDQAQQAVKRVLSAMMACRAKGWFNRKGEEAEDAADRTGNYISDKAGDAKVGFRVQDPGFMGQDLGLCWCWLQNTTSATRLAMPRWASGCRIPGLGQLGAW